MAVRDRKLEKVLKAQGHDLSGLTPKRPKYGNKKTVVDGITFDSKKEAQYYANLKLRQAAGEIYGFQLQPKFTLIPAEKGMRACVYAADFRVVHNDGRTEIVDVKGHKTEVYRLKKKMMKFLLGIAVAEA